MEKHKAVTIDGRITDCTLPIGQEGKGRCNHIAHQKKDESIQEFVKRVEVFPWENQEFYKTRMIDQSGPEGNKNNSALNRWFNRKAYMETKQMLDEYGVCCLVQGTSTGKSSVICRICEDYHNNKNILIITPSKEQADQLKFFKVKASIATYNAFNKFDEDKLNEYDMIIIDEVHHIGKDTNKCAEQLKIMKENNENLLIMGSSATPLRTDLKNPIKSIFDGRTSSNISTEEVFESGDLVKPKIVQLEDTNYYKDELNKLLKKSATVKQLEKSFNRVSQLKEKLIAQDLKNDKIICDQLTEKIKINISTGEASKMIIHCPDASTGMDYAMEKYLPIIQKACDNNNIKMEANKFVNSNEYKMTSSKRKEIFSNFKKNNDKVEVVFVYDMLGEGVHVDGVNMGLNLRHTTSRTQDSQTLGRYLNGPDKQKSAPLYIDLSDNLDKKVSYSKCLTNRVQDNYGNIRKQFREIQNYGKSTYEYKGERVTEEEIVDILSDRNEYEFNSHNKKFIKNCVREKGIAAIEYVENNWYAIQGNYE